MIRVFHVTDDANFRVNPMHPPVDFLGAVDGRPLFGALFAALNMTATFWMDIAYYRTPRFVAVIEVADWIDNADIVQGRWFSEEIIILNPRALRVERVIPCLPCPRQHKFGPSWGRCDGYLNPWGGMCSNGEHTGDPIWTEELAYSTRNYRAA